MRKVNLRRERRRRGQRCRSSRSGHRPPCFSIVWTHPFRHRIEEEQELDLLHERLLFADHLARLAILRHPSDLALLHLSLSRRAERSMLSSVQAEPSAREARSEPATDEVIRLHQGVDGAADVVHSASRVQRSCVCGRATIKQGNKQGRGKSGSETLRHCLQKSSLGDRRAGSAPQIWLVLLSPRARSQQPACADVEQGGCRRLCRGWETWERPRHDGAGGSSCADRRSARQQIQGRPGAG